MLAEPSAVVAVLAAGWLYWRGLSALWRKAGPGRVVSRRQVVAFGAGLATLLLALESPLDALSAKLFSAHMVQHLLLIVVAAPLLVLGAPLAPMLWGLPADARRGVGLGFRKLMPLCIPGVALTLHSVALWVWHVPLLYEAALASRGIHVLEHLSFVLTAVLFWWTIVRDPRRAYGAGALYVLVLALEGSLLGALLTFADAPWYAAHLFTTAEFGITPQQDQQLAGLIMWVPGGFGYLAVALVLLLTWLRGVESGGRVLDRAGGGRSLRPGRNL